MRERESSLLVSETLLLHLLGKSLMNSRKSRKPSTVPCVVPLTTSSQGDLAIIIEVCYYTLKVNKNQLV